MYNKESSKKYYQENKERIKTRQKAYYENNPEYREKIIEVNKKRAKEIQENGRLNTYG